MGHWQVQGDEKVDYVVKDPLSGVLISEFSVDRSRAVLVEERSHITVDLYEVEQFLKLRESVRHFHSLYLRLLIMFVIRHHLLVVILGELFQLLVFSLFSFFHFCILLKGFVLLEFLGRILQDFLQSH